MATIKSVFFELGIGHLFKANVQPKIDRIKCLNALKHTVAFLKLKDFLFQLLIKLTIVLENFHGVKGSSEKKGAKFYSDQIALIEEIVESLSHLKASHYYCKFFLRDGSMIFNQKNVMKEMVYCKEYLRRLELKETYQQDQSMINKGETKVNNSETH
eukprot:CAMPEP_0170565596 /NCGR_PEP_ID=MMETSP0211-20121228/79290_1 /TAXON_ID=311385 /ORGANISM="Pseudokeronopsis sp., Strain OXSARD2" /LENGTH=156 /DNA_ID=CAMNT_0010886513 /DNA_START=2243 /DNA_END=2713 /DNA_ORIENTATION=-